MSSTTRSDPPAHIPTLMLFKESGMLTSHCPFPQVVVVWLSVLTTVLMALVLLPCRTGAFEIRLATGQSGTFSHFTGQQLCRIINTSQNELQCTTVPNADELHNLTNLRSGSLDIGLVDSRTLYDALHQAGSFAYLDISYQTLRLIMPVNNVPVALVVRSDARIDSLDALQGKRVNAGMPGSVEHRVMELIMEAKEWTKKDFSLFEELSSSQSENTMALCHGTIQAMLHIGVHPDPRLERLFNICKARLTPMEDPGIARLVESHPAYFQVSIPAAAYESMHQPVTTFGTRTLLVAPEGLDEDIVRSLVRIIDRNLESLTGIHPGLTALRAPSSDPADPKLRLHPGAAVPHRDQGSP